MKKMTIYKNKAIEAIETEPILIAGKWFQRGNVKTCSVCAVGSVLRKNCFTTKTNNVRRAVETITEFEDSWCTLKGAVKSNASNAYLSNLSCAFEGHVAEIDPNSDEMRMLLINEICGTWPDQFEIEFDSY